MLNPFVFLTPCFPLYNELVLIRVKASATVKCDLVNLLTPVSQLAEVKETSTGNQYLITDRIR